jgi:hypothetical protein
MADERGQTLLEFVAIVPVIAAVILGTGWLLSETNRRTECTRLVFEAVRSRLEGGAAVSFRIVGGELRNVEDGVEGKLKCGLHTEALFLPKIDRRKSGGFRGTSAGASPFPSSF